MLTSTGVQMTRRNLTDLVTGVATGRRRTGSSGKARVRLPEHCMVRLASHFDLGDGRTLPVGALGAVVFVHGNGEAYEVEFIEPFHAVATIPALDLSQAPAA